MLSMRSPYMPGTVHFSHSPIEEIFCILPNTNIIPTPNTHLIILLASPRDVLLDRIPSVYGPYARIASCSSHHDKDEEKAIPNHSGYIPARIRHLRACRKGLQSHYSIWLLVLDGDEY